MHVIIYEFDIKQKKLIQSGNIKIECCWRDCCIKFERIEDQILYAVFFIITITFTLHPCCMWRTNIMLICDIIQCQIVLCSEQMPLDAWCSEIIVFFILFYCLYEEWFLEKITSSEIYLNFTNLLSTDISLRSKIKGKFLEVAIVCREMVEVAFL